MPPQRVQHWLSNRVLVGVSVVTYSAYHESHSTKHGFRPSTWAAAWAETAVLHACTRLTTNGPGRDWTEGRPVVLRHTAETITRVQRLRDEDGLSFPAIALEVGLEEGQVRGIYRRAPKTLTTLRQPPGERLTRPVVKPVVHPQGWEPGVILEGNRGTINSGPGERNVDWDAILDHFGFDPKLFEIEEPVNVRTWMAAVGNGETKQMWYHKANIRRRRSAEDHIDVESLIREIKTHRKGKAKDTDGDAAFLMCLSDWQIGKPDGDGTDGTIRRVMEAIDMAVERIKELRRAGRRLGTLYYTGMGDLVESCIGHYDMQTFGVQLDRRDQVKVVRRLLLYGLRVLAPLFKRVVVTCVPGNHGENRLKGKAFTTWGDNDDIAVFEQVAEILQAAPETYGHVSFVIPDQELVATFDVCGTIVAFAHGHQARSGATRSKQLEDWWRGQQAGRQPAGDADILIVAHGHHLLIIQNGVRTIFQCPALESDSAWWRHIAGTSCPPGVMTMVVDRNGWSDVQVLRPTGSQGDTEAA